VLTRMVRIQVIAFVLASLLGVAYVGVRYVGLGFGTTYTVHIDLDRTGGLFTHAPVTYRGVPVGQVGPIQLHGELVRADLVLDRSIQVPADLTAVVSQRSAVGEQYLDLRPRGDTGPYLRDGDTIARDHTATPLPVETFLSGLDALVGSIGVDNLEVLINELGQAFEGNEGALRTLLDANSALLTEAEAHLPETLALIRDGRTVLQTQAESAGAIRRWAASLAQLAATVRAADPDLRRLLAEGPGAAAELIRLLHGLEPAVGTLLANLVSTGDIAARRLPGIEQILVTYPIAVAGGFTVVPGDGTAHLGLVLNVSDPAACNYTASGVRTCTPAERAGGSGVRSSANAPRAGGSAAQPPAQQSTQQSTQPSTTPPPTATTIAGYDPATGVVLGPDGQPLRFGGTGGQYQLAGDQSWKQLLLAGLTP
jgi:phospholipid/cholesterol/gamma-HCH transport system substrate-binding protein